MKARLSIDVVEESELPFWKICSKCRQSCNNIDVIIPCGGWNDILCEKDSCEYWIHKSTDRCQTEHNVYYCSSYFTILNSLPNDDNTRSINDAILRTTSIDDDVMTELNNDGSEGVSITHTVISESCKSVFSKLN